MRQRKNMTAQQRNGTTNSSPRSAVRRSRPSFLRFTASRTDFRRMVGGTRSKERGRGSGNGRVTGQHAPAPAENGVPALQTAAFFRRRDGKLRTKRPRTRRTTASRKRPARRRQSGRKHGAGPGEESKRPRSAPDAKPRAQQAEGGRRAGRGEDTGDGEDSGDGERPDEAEGPKRRRKADYRRPRST